MASGRPPDTRDEEFWREYLTRGDSLEAVGRRIFKRIPHEPRCRLCAAPFAGPGAPVMRLRSKLDLKGKQAATEVVTLRIGPST